jgi:hypothetical protein
VGLALLYEVSLSDSGIPQHGWTPLDEYSASRRDINISAAISLYSSPIIIRMMKLRGVRQAENIASKKEGNEKYMQILIAETEKSTWENQGLCRRVVLRGIFQSQDRRYQTRSRPRGRLF